MRSTRLVGFRFFSSEVRTEATRPSERLAGVPSTQPTGAASSQAGIPSARASIRFVVASRTMRLSVFCSRCCFSGRQRSIFSTAVSLHPHVSGGARVLTHALIALCDLLSASSMRTANLNYLALSLRLKADARDQLCRFVCLYDVSERMLLRKCAVCLIAN
eukprot:2511170-Pleurochrysis_carterae.AAC.1